MHASKIKWQEVHVLSPHTRPPSHSSIHRPCPPGHSSLTLFQHACTQPQSALNPPSPPPSPTCAANTVSQEGVLRCFPQGAEQSKGWHQALQQDGQPLQPTWANLENIRRHAKQEFHKHRQTLARHGLQHSMRAGGLLHGSLFASLLTCT